MTKTWGACEAIRAAAVWKRSLDMYYIQSRLWTFAAPLQENAARTSSCNSRGLRILARNYYSPDLVLARGGISDLQRTLC
jgi:hypothetical protein